MFLALSSTVCYAPYQWRQKGRDNVRKNFSAKPLCSCPHEASEEAAAHSAPRAVTEAAITPNTVGTHYSGKKMLFGSISAPKAAEKTGSNMLSPPDKRLEAIIEGGGVTVPPAGIMALAAELLELRGKMRETTRIELPADRPSRKNGQAAYLAALPGWLQRAADKMDANCFGYRGDHFLLDAVDVEFLAGVIHHVLAPETAQGGKL